MQIARLTHEARTEEITADVRTTRARRAGANKAAEMGIASQLDKVEELDVDIKTDPFKAIQGQVDSVDIEGKGMVMQGDLRMEELDMHMSGVAINSLSAALVKLNYQAHRSKHSRCFIRSRYQPRLQLRFYSGQTEKSASTSHGKPTTIEPQQVDFRLPGEGKVSVNATVMLPATRETKQVAFTAVPKVGADGQTVILKDVQYGEGEELSPELTKALVDQLVKF
jgi:hypothetical protein